MATLTALVTAAKAKWDAQTGERKFTITVLFITAMTGIWIFFK